MNTMSGSITVSTCSSATAAEVNEVNGTYWGVKRPKLLQRRVQLQRQPVHMFVNQNSDDILMSECTNVSRFCLQYNEEHILMPYSLPSIHQAIVEDDAPVKIDTNQQLVQLVFLVRVRTKCTMLDVAPDTKLRMLLNIGCLNVEQLILTGTQMHHLL